MGVEAKAQGKEKPPRVGWKRSEVGQLDNHSHHQVGGREGLDPMASPLERVSHHSLGNMAQGDHVKGSEWGVSLEATTRGG